MNMMHSDTVTLDTRGRIGILSLNRPDRLNAINHDVKLQLDAAVENIKSNPDLRVVVIKGEGRAFCAGGDLDSIKENRSTGESQNLELSHRILRRLTGLDQIVIACVHGFAAGAGCNLALAADLVYAARGTRFSQAFIKVGLVPDWGGMYLLPHLAGNRKAKEWILFGEPITAEEALAYGLINAVFEEDELFEKVMARAEKLASSPWAAVRLVKKVLDRDQKREMAPVLKAELEAFDICSRTPDFEEGVNAFLEKRKPVFE